MSKLKALYTSEVEDLCSKVLDKEKVNFMGARSAHDFPPIDTPTPFAVIFNTATRDKKGDHWIAMYRGDRSKVKTNFGYFFDTYGVGT